MRLTYDGVKVTCRPRKVAIIMSLALMAIVIVFWVLSCFKYAGRLHIDETWVQVPSAGMQELHTTRRLWWIIQGRFEASTTGTINAVVPSRSAAESPTQHGSYWIWQPADPIRVRAWDDRWHVTSWNEWRLGGLGWYVTTGGGATSRVLSVPLWIVMLIVGTPCWSGLARTAKMRWRRRRGLCTMCGYNRRGIAHDSACPECGMLPVAK
jgi:hypothetical protein